MFIEKKETTKEKKKSNYVLENGNNKMKFE